MSWAGIYVGGRMCVALTNWN